MPGKDFDEDVTRGKLGPIKARYKPLTLNLVVDSKQEQSETIHFTASASEEVAGETKQVAPAPGGILVVSALNSTPLAGSRIGATPGSVAHPGLFERNIEAELPAAACLPMSEGNPRVVAEKGVTSSSVPEDLLVRQPIVTYPQQPTVSPTRVRPPALSKQPDFLALFKGRAAGNPGQVEVFEVTLDAHFVMQSTRTEASDMAISHKRTQIPGTIEMLAARFPGVQIIYNIRSDRPPPPVVRNELEAELRNLRKRNSSLSIQIIWRIG